MPRDELRIHGSIDTGGGPLLVASRNAVIDWVGTDGGDYDYACNVTEYIELLQIRSCLAMALGDEPTPTWLGVLGEDLYLFRWFQAPSEDAFLQQMMPAALEESGWVPDFAWSHTHPELVVFDSAYPFREINDYLSVRVPPGDYSVSTRQFDSGEVVAVLHRLQRRT